MGLLEAGVGAAAGVLADSWREFFYCDALPENVLVRKGQKRTGNRTSNKRGEDNIISNGSIIAVNEGQCMMIVESGEVVELSAKPGKFVYDASTEPSIFYGSLGENIKNTFAQIGKRFTFGGDTGKDQRIYYFNTKEIYGNKYGTSEPIPLRIVDNEINFHMDTTVRCHGMYSYIMSNPLLFYSKVCGNVEEDFTRDRIDESMKNELVMALTPTLAQITSMGIRYSELPAHVIEIANVLNDQLSKQWREGRGIEIKPNTFGITLRIPEEDEKRLKDMQSAAALTNPAMAAGHLVYAQGQAMQDAAKNQGGAMQGFMGMGMAMNAGGANAANLFTVAQQQQQLNMQQQQLNMQQQQQMQQPPAQPAAPQGGGWDCSCGATGNNGKFCSQCGSPKPADPNGWTCSCGAVNKGKFCPECGSKKPAGAPLYKCDKCGWEPEDPTHPPKFCPECGDIFDDNDQV